MRLEPEHHDEARQIAKELAAIARSGLVLPGSIVERRTVCGRANCACHKDPSRRHGPYFQWTRKVAKRLSESGSRPTRTPTTKSG